MIMRMVLRRCIFMAAIGFLALPAQAVELRVLAADPVRDVVTAVGAEFTKQTGTRLKFTFASVRALQQKLEAEERADVLILTPPVLDELMFAETVKLGRRVNLVREGLGVAVKSGTRAPDCATPEALRKALLAAPVLACGNPKSTASGAQTASVLNRLGIADSVRAKSRFFAGNEELLGFLGKGNGTELGIAPVSAIRAGAKDGVQLAAPLPKDVQVYTTYTAAVVQSARAPKDAQAFVTVLTSPQARQRFAAAGFDTAP